MSSIPQWIKCQAQTYRVGLTFFFIFFASSALLLGGAAFFLNYNIEAEIREVIQTQSEHYVDLANTQGTQALQDELRNKHSSNQKIGFFFRLHDANGVLLWETFPSSFNLDEVKRELGEPEQGWRWIDLIEENDLELLGLTLENGALFEIGHATGRQEEILEDAYHTALLFLVATIIFGIIGAVLFTYRITRPVKRLAQTVQDVTAGELGRRVSIRQGDTDLNKLALSFNTMLERIETLVQAQRTTLDTVAHDFRTPLSRLRMGVERALTNQEINKDEILMDVAEEVNRLDAMITMLMDVAEAETGQMKMNPEALVPDDLLADLESLYEFVAEDRGISMAFIPGKGSIWADRLRMIQAMGNLLDNALKYTPQGGHVAVRTFDSTNHCIIEVEDSGPGIPTQERERVFERLFRLDASRTTKGLGLGLTLVKAVVTAHNGTISVTQGELGGCHFIIKLPHPKS